MLIPIVDGRTRSRLVIARAEAMRSGCAAGIAHLSDETGLPDTSRVALLMQHCEILYLDQQFDNACKVYDTAIDPLLERLSPECASLLADNRSTIAFALFQAESSNQFYHQVDIRRLLGVELRNSSAALEAERSASAGKHYEAFPIIWRLLLEAYRKQNWRALHWAHAHMARECMALNWPDEAVWHAIQALDKELVLEASKALIASRDKYRVAIGIDKILMFSKLAKHTCLAAHFLYAISDCIPDEQVEKVMEWTTNHLDFVPTGWANALLFEPIWKLVGRLAPRMDQDSVLAIAHKAVNHPVFANSNRERRHLINSCTSLFQVIAPHLLNQFISPVFSLVTDHKSDFDFVDSLNLLCLLAEKNETCRDEFRAALFPQGVEISNPLLLQVAPLLGWHPQGLDEIHASAANIALSIRKQVEVIDSTAEPSNLGGFCYITKEKDAEKIVVHMGGGQHWIDAMAANLGDLPDAAVSQLIEAMLEMIADDRNVVANRISLLHSLIKFMPRLPTDIAQHTSQIISQIAQGNFRESEVGQTYEEANNPLNPFKISSGDPSELRGVALLALARGSKIYSEFSAELHSGLLLNFLEIENDKLKEFGVASALGADCLSELEITALIANCLDAPLKARKYALYVLGSVMSVDFDRQGLRLGVRAIRSASHSTDAGERAEAARAAKSLLRYTDGEDEIRTRLTEILKNLSNDISHYVRSCCALGVDG
ncbi:MAG: hypothetical protein VB050_12725 [Geobacteraceae bacterium]|nr:hypothetical protein [Geobacteraceae bacterium]